MKIMSGPSSASMIVSVSSSAALRPISGFAPAPNPLVSLAPNCNFAGACDSFSACKSVFAAMNSTPSTLARIIRLTALQPPPPTPMTLSFAGESSSLKLIRIPASFAVMLAPFRLVKSFYKSRVNAFPQRVFRPVEKRLKLTLCPPSLSRRIRPASGKTPLEAPHVLCPRKHRPQLRHQIPFDRNGPPGFRRVQHQAHYGRVLRHSHLL